ncbi:sortase domain-bontaining protein [Salinibacterium sp. GXW1014]|uniref:class F sortase n=1 Tax=Salinibacterium sp. GXW1014 TaxID=3377838 RepID=UPI00383B4047
MSKRTIAGALGALAIALALVACTGTTEPTAPLPAIPSPSPSAVAPTPAVEVPVRPATPEPARQPVPPVQVAIPDIGVSIPVVEVGIETGGFMELPENPAIAGWYRFGSDPSSPQGNTVISAHVDAGNYPIGPFSKLRNLGAGATTEVTDAAGTSHLYSVQSVTYYPKKELPVAELFGRDGSSALVLITCGGDFDSSIGRYEDNVVVIATPAA